MRALLQDVRFAIRTLSKSPGFTIVIVLTLALGIGANTAIFALVNAILLKPLPYEDPERLVLLWATHPENGLEKEQLSPVEFRDWEERNQVFESIVAFLPNPHIVTGPGESEYALGYSGTPGFFQLLGAEAMIGRTFSPEEETPGTKVIVLRHEFALRQFGKADVVGETLYLEEKPYDVIGVMPPEFQFFSRKTKMFLPPRSDPFENSERSNRWVRVMARLKPGVSMDEAQAHCNIVAQGLAQEYPESNFGWKVRLTPLALDSAGPLVPALWILLATVGIVLAIACANVANLLLVQVSSRNREVALRTALGASRGRIIRQLLSESFLWSLLGGVGGLALGCVLVAYFQHVMPGPTSIARTLVQLDQVRIDARVLMFTAAAALGTTFLFGLWPAVRASRPNLTESLKDIGRGATSGPSGRRMREVLVVGEIALALMMMIGAGLLIQSFANLYKAGPGFRPDGVISMHITSPWWKYWDPENPEVDQKAAFAKLEAFQQELVSRVEALPGVRSVSTSSSVPMQGYYGLMPVLAEDAQASSSGDLPQVLPRWASPNYFQTMGIPLLKGRSFQEQDRPDSPRAAIVNEALARRLWPEVNPVGRRLRPAAWGSEPPWFTVVGVVGNVREEGMDQPPLPTVYLARPSSSVLVIRAEGDPTYLASLVRRELQATDPAATLDIVRKMEDAVLESTWRYRYTMLLLSGLATLSLILALVGVYGVVSFAVAQRTQEIGVRMALGATSKNVLGLVARDGLRFALAGTILGTFLSLALTHLLSSQLFGVEPTDPTMFVGIPFLLAAVTLLACYVPARRAAKVHPIVALRHE